MLQKKSAPLNFTQGIDTKTDSKQIQFGKFRRLVNSVFTTLMRMTKRPGYLTLAPLPLSADFLTTFSDNLTAIGTSLQAYSSGNNSWISKGNFQPLKLSVLPTIRSALNQTQCDSVIASNGLACTVFTESNNGVLDYKYAIEDSVTGQSIINPTLIPVGSGAINNSPRVFLLGGYFIIGYATDSGHLQYVAISITHPSIVTTPNDIAASVVSSSTLNWDGVVVGPNLYLAYNTTAGGQQINVTYLNTSFVIASPVSFTSSIATIMSVTSDITNAAQPIIYAAFWDAAGSTGHAIAVDQNLNKVMTATQWLGTGAIQNITCTAQDGVLRIAYEYINTYGYASSVRTDYISKNTITKPATVTTGTLGTAAVVVRSVGIASKAFLYNDVMYMLCAYQSSLQSTYFLIDIDGNVISRFAYENGGGYLTTGLPQAQVIGTTINISYLYKDLIQSQNTIGLVESIGPAGASNIYSQTGINLAFIDFTSSTLVSSEIGENLHLSGGMLWVYDGQVLNEQGFHLFPDNIVATWTTSSVVTPTGTFSSGSTTVVVSSATGISIGMSIADTTNSGYIPSGTYITGIVGTTLTISQATTHSAAGDNLSIQGNIVAKPDGSTNTDAYYYQVTYEWTDNQGNIIRSAPSVPVAVTTSGSGSAGIITVDIPTLRLTYKTDVKIVIYRWSVAQQIYYQVTSIIAPTLNSTTVDYIAYVDTLPDIRILGNEIIYTTGGVLENIAGPAFIDITLFDNRLWGIEAEDTNLLWESKQVIESVPVEMSDFLTTYVAPTSGAQGSTGPLKCIFPMDDKIVLFKKDAAYYINGTGGDNTGANSQYSQPIFITSSVGCANKKSIVLIPNGLMFQSDKGIWLLGRDLSTQYIGADVEEFNSQTITSANSIPATTYVLFTLSNGVTLMYDYFVGQWGFFEGFNAVSSTLYQGLHTFINSVGSVGQQSSGTTLSYLDLGNPVLMSFLTSWLNLTGLQGYQRAYFFYLLGQYITPHKLQLGIAYDYNPSFYTAPLITPGNSNQIYGTVGPYGQAGAGTQSDLENWRVFLKKQRCQAFQISLEEVYDPSFGIAAGAGLTLSGLNLIYGSKQSFRPIAATKSVG